MRNKFTSFFCLFFAVLLSFWISILLGILFYILWLCLSPRVNTNHYLFPIFIFACIGFTTYSSWNEGDSDIVRYYSAYEQFKKLPIQLSLFNIISQGKDLGFYIMMLLVSTVLPSDPRWLSFYMICLTTTLYLLSFKYFNKGIYSHKRTLCLWILCFIFINSFYNYTNAYRQYLAYAIVLISIQYPYNKLKAIFLSILAISCHWSMIMLIIPYYAYRSFKSIKIPNISLFICLLLGLLGFGDLLYAFNSNTDAYANEQILGVDKTLMCVQFITTTIVCYIFLNLKKYNSSQKTLLYALISLTAITYLFIKDSTVITRLSFNWTSLYIIILPILLNSRNEIVYRQKNTLVALCCITFLTYNYISLLRGIPLSYMIFTNYGIQSSFSDIINSTNPF